MEAKTYIKKDGTERIKFIREEYADNPRGTTDEPLHCADWSRSCSIMTKDDTRYDSLADLLGHLLAKYASPRNVIDFLVDNGRHMTDGKCKTDNALKYDRSERCWVLYEYGSRWGKEDDWREMERYHDRKEDIDICDLLANVTEQTLTAIASTMKDIRFAEYTFNGWNDRVAFYEGISSACEGLAWIEKDEFLKYTGLLNQDWETKTFHELVGWLTDEISAWSEGEVYRYTVEKAKTYKIHKECTSADEPAQDYEETEWEETDSCCGFYGELDKTMEWMFNEAGLNKFEFEEVETEE